MKEYIAEYIVPVEKKGNDYMFDFMNATPLIRCKDCIHFSETKKRGAISHSCGYAYGCICPEPDGYCNFAETKRHDD